MEKHRFLSKPNSANIIQSYIYSIEFNDRNPKTQSLDVCPIRLVEVTCYGSQISLYDVETAVPSVLKPDLIDV